MRCEINFNTILSDESNFVWIIKLLINLNQGGSGVKSSTHTEIKKELHMHIKYS